MSPGPRRDLTPFVVVLVAGAVCLFLLVGGLASVGRSSGPFHDTIDRSFGAQARLLVAQSNLVGQQLRSLVGDMTALDRSQLSGQLDELVTGTQSVASLAQSLSSPAPEGQVGPEFVGAMTGRDSAVIELRRTVDGLLAITPGDGASSSPNPPPSVTSAQAARRLTSIGQLLVTADRSYAEARRRFASLPGGFRLPTSVWVTQPVLWEAGAVETTVNQLSSSPELAPAVDVQLLAVALEPPLLPPAPAVAGQAQAPPIAAGASEVPPTCTLSVTAVVGNEGSVVATKVAVRASVQSVVGGTAFVVQKLVTLAPSASVARALPSMPVVPGGTYNVTVTIEGPPGQSPVPAPMAATVAVASYGSVRRNAFCSRTPAAAP